MKFDAIIIGAGVAGLAAARELARAGASFIVLEARERIGGRIFTVRDERCPIPIELGAEFLHGEAKETMQVIRASGVRAIDVNGRHWRAKDGNFRPLGDFYHDIDLVMRKLDGRGADQSFAEFLAGKPGGRQLARQRKLALEFVQGFHACDVNLISAHALAEGGSPGEDPEEQRMGRVIDGYDQVPAALAAGLHDHILLGIEATDITWQRGSVRVTASNGQQFDARTVLVTVPLGVLQSGTLRFTPEIASMNRAITGLAMGEVLRLALLFDEPFWEEHDEVAGKSFHDFGYLHATEQPIPVWWSAFPTRAPVLVGWAGGGKARALRGATRDELISLAIGILAEQFSISRRSLAQKLVAGWTHDWHTDPHALGAYSYPVVGGVEAGAELSRSAGRTVFFAGEAASPEGRNGTVDGAIASGQKAGKRLVSALS
jgi:monoamine oxidase